MEPLDYDHLAFFLNEHAMDVNMCFMANLAVYLEVLDPVGFDVRTFFQRSGAPDELIEHVMQQMNEAKADGTIPTHSEAPEGTVPGCATRVAAVSKFPEAMSEMAKQLGIDVEMIDMSDLSALPETEWKYSSHPPSQTHADFSELGLPAGHRMGWTRRTHIDGKIQYNARCMCKWVDKENGHNVWVGSKKLMTIMFNRHIKEVLEYQRSLEL